MRNLAVWVENWVSSTNEKKFQKFMTTYTLSHNKACCLLRFRNLNDVNECDHIGTFILLVKFGNFLKSASLAKY